MQPRSRSSHRVPWLLTGLALLATAAPGFGQAEPEEIIVTGRYGPLPESVRTVSTPVSYADLDLSTLAGREELRRRVRLTARFLCDKLGETNTSSTGPVPSCRDDATRDAMKRLGTLEQGAAPRGTAWVAGPPWPAPYPPDWVTIYPD